MNTGMRQALAVLALCGSAMLTLGAGAYAQSSGVTTVPVPRVTIYPGQVVRAAQLEWRRWRASDPRLETAARKVSEVVGRVAGRTLVARYPIDTAQLQTPSAVTVGQIVPIVFKAGGITIHSKAVALQMGAVGAIIQVRNLDSSRVITGRVSEDGVVHVGGGS